MIIYKTSNLINGKSYVGQDSKGDLNYFGSGIYLKRAIQKYGRKNFQKEIIAWCDTKDKLNFLEKFFIDFFKTKSPNGYNIADGGDGGNLGLLVNKKISKALKGFKRRPGLKRRPALSETKKKMSERRKGIHLSLGVKEKISKGLKGRFLTKEHKKKLSEVMKGRHHSKETRHKMSEIHKGLCHSEETKRKLSEMKTGKRIDKNTKKYF